MRILLALGAATMLFATVAEARDVRVRGYTRQDGTYVEAHRRSSPNNTTSDNWSTYPNVNPYTGQQGTNRSNNYPTYQRPQTNSTPNYPTYPSYNQSQRRSSVYQPPCYYNCD